jgi:DNA gyrase subunit A
MELLRDIDKETVNFVPNFDESLQEPSVLPSRFPNLLVNGSTGIAVGMATNIPPHNLGEVIDAVVLSIDNEDAELKDLMKVLRGPDFPTGRTIMGKRGISEAYETGRGGIRVRGQAQTEETRSGKVGIVITELPFQVNKARLAEKIAELVREKKLPEVSDLRDESDRSGMRLVIELKREAIPQIVLNKLYKHTQLEVTFGIIMLALVNGMPRILNLKSLLKEYVDFQKEAVIRRTRFLLLKAEERAHVLEGLMIALNNLDAVIKTIRESKDVDKARSELISRFDLDEIQAQAILDMRLQRLTQLEQAKIEEEHQELLKKIAEYKAILADEKKVLKIIKDELLELKEKYADKRRTKITALQAELSIEDLIAEEEMVVTISHSGYVKRLPLETYRRQRRGGRGILGMNLKDEDFVENLFISSTHHYVLFFSNIGKVYRLKVHELPLGSRISKGQAIVNILPFRQDEKIAAVISVPDFEEEKFLVMATKNGLVKKTPLMEYFTSRREGIIAINLREGDELISVKLTDGDEDVILVTRNGQSIRFQEEQVRPMGRAASGVKGIRLGKSDEVLGMEVVKEDSGDLFVITEKGYGKRTPIEKYPLQGRGGKGVRTIRTVEDKGKLTGAKMVKKDQELMVVSNEGIVIRMSVKGVPVVGRHTQGFRVMSVKGEDRVSAIARVVKAKEKEEAAQERPKSGKEKNK